MARDQLEIIQVSDLWLSVYEIDVVMGGGIVLSPPVVGYNLIVFLYGAWKNLGKVLETRTISPNTFVASTNRMEGINVKIADGARVSS